MSKGYDRGNSGSRKSLATALAYAAGRILAPNVTEAEVERRIRRICDSAATADTRVLDLLPGAEELFLRGRMGPDAYRVLKDYSDPDFGLDRVGLDARMLPPPMTLGMAFQRSPQDEGLEDPALPTGDGLNQLSRYRAF